MTQHDDSYCKKLENKTPVFGIKNQVNIFDEQGRKWAVTIQFNLTLDHDIITETKNSHVSSLVNRLQWVVQYFYKCLIDKLTHPETLAKLEEFLSQTGERSDT